MFTLVIHPYSKLKSISKGWKKKDKYNEIREQGIKEHSSEIALEVM